MMTKFHLRGNGRSSVILPSEAEDEKKSWKGWLVKNEPAAHDRYSRLTKDNIGMEGVGPGARVSRFDGEDGGAPETSEVHEESCQKIRR